MLRKKINVPRSFNRRKVYQKTKAKERRAKNILYGKRHSKFISKL